MKEFREIYMNFKNSWKKMFENNSEIFHAKISGEILGGIPKIKSRRIDKESCDDFIKES